MNCAPASPLCSRCRPRRRRQTFKSSAGDLKVETVAGGLRHPWALAFLPDGRMLVTERPGRHADRRRRDGKLSPPLARRAEGLRLRPGRPARRRARPRASRRTSTIYFCFAEPVSGGARTAMARATLADDGTARRRQGDLPSGRTAVERQPFRLPHRAERRQQPVPDHGRALHRPRRGAEADQPSRQDRADHARRLGAEATIRSSAAPTPSRKSGATVIATRRARRSIRRPASSGSTSTAPRGGDEVNIPQAGKNYGWPVIGYGVNYDGTPVGSGKAEMPGMEQPIKYWVPSIAPSGMAFYQGDLFPAWKGSLFVGALAGQMLVRLDARRRQGARARSGCCKACASASATCASGPTARSICVTDNNAGRILRVDAGEVTTATPQRPARPSA